MNKKLKFAFKSTIVLTTIGMLSLPVFGTNTLQKVEAYLNKTLSYTLDGKEIMKDVPALTYNNTTYISLAELNQALGHTIAYDETTRTISIVTSQDLQEEAVELPMLPEFMLIENATIKSINPNTKQVTILPLGQEDHFYNYVVLNVNDDTSIHHELNKRMYFFEDLEEGMKITVKHSPISTMSLPPQTPALEIIILQNQS